MFNPLDMLQAQNDAGMQSVAQQFGLTPEQTRRAMAALMPAFALGMQKAPAAGPSFFGLPGAPAANPAQILLGQMFGSPVLTQAMLQQASSASGVGSQVLRQMLPMMAGAVVASIVHMMLNQQAPEPAPAPAPASPFPANPVWSEMMKAFLPQGDAAQQAGTRSQAQTPPPAASPDTKPPAEAGPGLLQQMLRSGAEAQEQNVKAMQGLFETLWTEVDARKTRMEAPTPTPADATPPAPSQKPRKGRTPTR